MLDKQFFENISQSLCQLLPTELHETQTILKESFQSVLMQAFSQLEFVSREEFDIQVKVLARTREKLEALQKQVES
ncbi:MAG: accessory factor UbiK family protein [Gammaproteobacteria bacterium]|nr:accessory factor UbiK family protein [Gammaproteobacteria bacterium]